MADTGDARLMSRQSKQIMIVLANLFLYSVAMFTLPFAAFFGVRYITANYTDNQFTINVWSVAAAVVVVNIIIAAYAYKAYYEKEYDEDGNEIDQHAYPPSPVNPLTKPRLKEPLIEKTNLNLKHE